MSMLENLEFIQLHGLPAFIKKEEKRWQCPKCGGTICVHKHLCSSCGEPFAADERSAPIVPGKEIIDRIVTIEWDMFRNVNEPGARARCQEDRTTFEGMRRGQFEAWSAEAAESYLNDLNAAIASGRNLVMEKYIHMMKNISPLPYEKLVKSLTFPGKAGMRLVDAITAKMIAQTRDLFEKYPCVSGSCRPLYSVDDGQDVTSIETYQRGELQTYSNRTLKAYKKHLLALEAAGISLAQRILEGSIKHYGYKTLDEAEAACGERS